MSGFASVGECMIELSGAGGDQWRMGYAGDTLNTAWYIRALKELPYPVDYISAFGNDHFSRQQIEFLTGNKIGISASPLVEGLNPGLYAITLDGSERSFTYWRNNSAARRLASDRKALEKSLFGRQLIYFSGISVAIILPEDRANFFAVLRACRDSGSQIAFDPNFRAQLWPDKPLARQILQEAMQIADIALPTLPDEQALFGDADAASCAQRLADWGVREIVVKDGTDPALVLHDQKTTLVPSVKAAAIDTTGAGDSFNGGYLAARLNGLTPVEAAHKGHAVAARVVEVRGALAPMDIARTAFAG